MYETFQFWKSLASYSGWLATILGVIAALATALSFYASAKASDFEEKIKARNGILSPPKKKDAKFNQKKDEEITVWLGTNAFAIAKNMLRQGYRLQPLLGNTKTNLEIRLQNDRLLISGEFRSHDEKVIAEIKDNKWIINENNFFKMNYDDAGLEVIDEYGITKIQIEFEDENNIRIAGLFFNEHEEAFIINHMGITTGIGRNPSKSDLVQLSALLPDMFLYPTERHLGVRAPLTRIYQRPDLKKWRSRRH